MTLNHGPTHLTTGQTYVHKVSYSIGDDIQKCLLSNDWYPTTLTRPSDIYHSWESELTGP